MAACATVAVALALATTVVWKQLCAVCAARAVTVFIVVLATVCTPEKFVTVAPGANRPGADSVPITESTTLVTFNPVVPVFR
jgi:hypothetical protein